MKFGSVTDANGNPITGGGGAGGITDGGNKLYVTSSLAVSNPGAYASSAGSDAYFYVSGTIGLSGSTAKKTVFGGDVVVSGNLRISTQWPWQTAYEVDFASLPTLTASVDGNVTIDGKTWYAQNVINSAFVGIINGLGMTITSSATSTDFFNTTRTLSNFSTKLSNLDSRLVWPNAEFRVWCMMTGSGMLHNYELAHLVLEQNLGSPASYNVSVGYGWHTTGIRQSIRYEINNSSTEQFSTSRINDDVYVIHWKNPWHAIVMTGQSVSGTFPSINNLHIRGYVNQVVSNETIDAAYGLTDIDSLSVMLGGMTVNTTATSRFLWRQLRVEFK